MARSVTEDYDANARFSFSAVPQEPPLANLGARVLRWFLVAFKQSWLAVCLFRIKSQLHGWRVPLLPALCDLVSRALFNVSIGNGVRIGPGLMITHGNVIIDGRTSIGARCQISPFVTIGLTNSRRRGFSVDGPRLGDDVHIGTGAKVLGAITVGDRVRIGANAVVIDDVPADATVVGAPARIAERHPPAEDDGSGRDERLVAHMRDAIIGYRMQRHSLRSLVDALMGSFEIGSDDLRLREAAVQDDLIFLDAVAAADAGDSHQVTAAVDAIDRELATIA